MTALPCAIGVGFKPCHFEPLREVPGPVNWVEVHAENYLMAGGAMRAQLFELRAHMPVSLHGVGLSLGGETPPDKTHLMRLRRLIDDVKPAQFSEHLAWSIHDGVFANDLLPVAYTKDTKARVAAHIDATQQALGQKILIENPSLYLAFEGQDSAACETDFLSALVEATGCGLLVDVNNIHVTCHNLGWCPQAYLAELPVTAIGEVHLAGHAEDVDSDGFGVLVDNHGAAVADAVWALYDSLLALAGPLPSLVEWDTDIPDWPVLRGECEKAAAHLALAAPIKGAVA